MASHVHYIRRIWRYLIRPFRIASCRVNIFALHLIGISENDRKKRGGEKQKKKDDGIKFTFDAIGIKKKKGPNIFILSFCLTQISHTPVSKQPELRGQRQKKKKTLKPALVFRLQFLVNINKILETKSNKFNLYILFF